MAILDKRQSYRPFEYQQAYDYWERHELSYWLWNEVPMDGDVTDWETKLSPQEKSVIGGILKGFAQTECLVENYWLRAGLWFPKPEIAMMCSVFAEAESRHAKAYNFLNEKLGLEEYDAFLQQSEVAERISNLVNVKEEKLEDIAVSLAIFSGFCEGVSLFSAFATLMHFKLHNRLKGMGKMIEWSIKDECTHSEAGCWLFRTLLSEYPQLNIPELHEKVYNGARHALELELNYIDYVFREGSINGLQKEDLQEFIKMRSNTKLKDLGLEPIFQYDEDASNKITYWFGFMTASTTQTDFFANAEADYNKQTLVFNDTDW